MSYNRLSMSIVNPPIVLERGLKSGVLNVEFPIEEEPSPDYARVLLNENGMFHEE
jgi:hypothetical protein